MPSPLRVGIVGLEPGRSWAARAHVPALRALGADFRVVGVANSSFESSRAAADALDIPEAFADAGALAASPDIDVVAVTVRVSRHREVVRAALSAGKHVYCEWPLGNGLTEARELATMARDRGVHGVVGLQARVSPEVLHAKRLIADGRIGDVLSTMLVAYGGQWGGIVPNKRTDAYLLDAGQGATMLTIPVGHTLAGVQEVLGDLEQLSSVLATRRRQAVVAGTGETLPMTAHDQVLMSGLLTGGAPISLHYRGGLPRDGQGLLWEINGTRGDLRITAPLGHLQLAPLTLAAALGTDKAFLPLETPVDLLEGLGNDPVPFNVARNYARMAQDIRNGTHTASTFEDAVHLHEVIAAIERSADSGQREAIPPATTPEIAA